MLQHSLTTIFGWEFSANPPDAALPMAAAVSPTYLNLHFTNIHHFHCLQRPTRWWTPAILPLPRGKFCCFISGLRLASEPSGTSSNPRTRTPGLTRSSVPGLWELNSCSWETVQWRGTAVASWNFGQLLFVYSINLCFFFTALLLFTDSGPRMETASL